MQVEQPVLQALREQGPDLAAVPDRGLIEQCVERVVIDPEVIAITLRAAASGANHDQQDATDAATCAAPAPATSVLRVPWSRTPGKRRREIILPEHAESPDHRPIRAETRATLVRAIALGRRWLDELATGAMAAPQAIARREGCSQRQVERTISLAFLAPDLVRAAVEGRLPRGVGVSRLIDPPLKWQRQWRMLGLPH